MVRANSRGVRVCRDLAGTQRAVTGAAYRWWLPRAALLFFFFSSRRRHTRFDCDWSSDVFRSAIVPLIRITPASTAELASATVRNIAVIRLILLISFFIN